jgi:hypothetical protein
MSQSSPARVLRRALPVLVAACAFAAFLPTAAFADAPGAFVNDVTVTGPSTATVTGSVNPGGESTTYDVGYDLTSSAWCQDDGQSGSPANSTTPQTLGFTDTDDHDVSVDLIGLTPGTRYCAALIATNTTSTVTAFPATFGAGLPVASTDDASPTGASTATVDGEVNPGGQATTYLAEYDLDSSDWCESGGSSGTPQFSTQSQSLGFTDTSFHQVSIDLTGLIVGDDYCVDIVATNSSGSADGGQQFFEGPTPFAFTDDVTPTGPTTARVDGDIDPAGEATTYFAAYGPESSEWCQSGGATGLPATATNPQPLAFTDIDDHSVSVDLTGLSGATTYCAELFALNAQGLQDGGQIQFTTPTGPPTVTTGSATQVSANAANVAGTVNPNGLATTWHFEYGATTAYGSATPSQSAVTDSTTQAESAMLVGLAAHTTYHYRLVGTNSAGTTAGPDRTVTTSSPPTVSTNRATELRATKAMIHGTVNPNGMATTVHFDYGKTSHYGASTKPGSAGSGSTAVTATSTLVGLSPNTTYHYRLVATNAAGTTDGTDRTFKTSAPGPTLSHVALASPKFSASTGTKLRFTLSERARLTIAIKPKAAGHKAKVITLKFVGGKGRDSHRLTVPNLRPGSYTATITARDAAGRASKPATFKFTITGP